jgi:hypothetical protein
MAGGQAQIHVRDFQIKEYVKMCQTPVGRRNMTYNPITELPAKVILRIILYHITYIKITNTSLLCNDTVRLHMLHKFWGMGRLTKVTSRQWFRKQIRAYLKVPFPTHNSGIEVGIAINRGPNVVLPE